MNKRGLSMIITTLILIVLVLVAVAIIWVVVNNILKGGTEGIALGKFTLDAGIKNVNIDNSSNNVSLTVKRNPGKGELSGMKFIFYDGTNSEIITEEDMTLKELEQRRFNFHLININVDNLIRISIVPIFKSDSGKEIMGNIVDTYNVKDGVGCIANCTDKECGSDGCGGICGDCVILHGDGWYCQDGTCIEGTNPCDLTSASWSASSVVEGTLVSLNVAGTDCTGIDLNYTIWEDDALLNPDDFADSFIATGLGTTWITEWQDDTDGGQSNPPEYYFIARVVGETEEVTSSAPLLEVTQGCTITCATGPGCRSSLANGQIVSGECCGTGDCYDCETGYSWNGSACIAGCIPDCSCASITCVGETCSDGCEGTCAGTLAPDDCGVRVCGPAPNGCGGSEYCGTCGVGESCVDGNCAVLTAYYVRSGATGNNDGSDWENAWTTLPAALERGAVYYIADGDYLSYRFDDVESGTQYITIKKAIESDHGIDTGWVSGYGDGQAIFEGTTNIINFIRGYYIFDGQIGSGDDKSSYGFRITSETDCDQANRLVGIVGYGYSSYNVDYVNFSHTAISACGYGVDGTLTQIGIYSNPVSYSADNIIVSNNFLEGGSANVLLRNWRNSTIENNWFGSQWSSPSNHGQQISPGSSCDDIIFRGNTFVDSVIFVISMHSDNNKRWKIYNNIVIGGQLSGAFANGDSSTSDVFLDSEFHHNTFVNVDCGGRGAVFVGTLTDVDNQKSYSYNNLFYNCHNCNMDNSGHTAGAIVYDYNAYFDSTGVMSPGINGFSTTGNPFVNSAGGNYHLTQGVQAIDAGKSDLGSPYNIDLDGINRDDYTPWDIGAYEYVA